MMPPIRESDTASWRISALLAQAWRGTGPGAIVARGSVVALVLIGVGSLIVFVNQILLARLIGTAGYGDYAYVLAWVGVLGTVAVLGQTGAARRFVPLYRSAGRGALLDSYLHWTIKLVAATAFGMVVVGVFIVAASRQRLGMQLTTVFWLGFALLPFHSILDLVSSHLIGFKRVSQALFAQRVLRPLVLAAFLLGAGFWQGWVITPQLAAGATVAAAVAALAVASSMLRATTPPKPSESARPETREWLSVGLSLTLIAGASIILASTDTVMLGMLRGTRTAGLYSVASRAAAFVPFMLYAAANVAAPMIVEYHAAGDHRRLRRVMHVGAWVSTIFALATAASLVAAGRWLLLLFGEAFLDAYTPLIVLAGGQVVNCLCGMTLTLLATTGQQKAAATLLVLASLLNIGANALLIPPLGMLGAALASTGAIVLWNGAMVMLAMNRYTVNTTVFASSHHGD